MFTSGKLKQNLHAIKADINDTDVNSKFFNIIDLGNIYHIGKHYFGMRGSHLLKPGSAVYGEMLDHNGDIIPLYLVNKSYGNTKGVAALCFEITEKTSQGDAILTIVGTSRDNKTVKWQQRIHIVNDTINKQDEFSSFLDLPFHVPVEVYGLQAEITSGSQQYPLSQSWQTFGTGAYYSIVLRWVNHKYYSVPYYATQSQGFSRYDIITTLSKTADPAISKISRNILDNISHYHIFMFESYTASNGGFLPPAGYPRYYPGRQDVNGNKSGSWYYVGSIDIKNMQTHSLSDEYIYYVINNLKPASTYYFYVAMTTTHTLSSWKNNLWNELNKLE